MARKRMNPTRSEGQDGDEWESFLADLRGHVFRNLDSDGGCTQLAARADLSPLTIERFIYGDTKSPHLKTLFKLFKAIYGEDFLRRAIKEAFARRSESNVIPIQEGKRKVG